MEGNKEEMKRKLTLAGYNSWTDNRMNTASPIPIQRIGWYKTQVG
jgi:hypothetical protein